MKFVTFNIRCDYEQDGIQNFCHRKNIIEKKIKKEQPDIICFQEVLPHVALWLKETFTDYYVVGCGRDKEYRDEQAAVAYKKDCYNLMEMQTFWLSPTPDIPGSRYENQSECPRTCTVVTLEEIYANQVVRICNTHLDHIGSEARKLGLEQILSTLDSMKSFGTPPIILTGDFNAFPSDEEMKVINQRKDFIDVTEMLSGTFHDYGTLENTEKIDYIFAQMPLIGKNAVLWRDCENGIYLSDHYPVSVEMYTDTCSFVHCEKSKNSIS